MRKLSLTLDAVRRSPFAVRHPAEVRANGESPMAKG